jgi:superfamily II DNA or RNA helicase/intein/homing endonuclease
MPQINIYVSNRIFIQIPTDVLTPDLDAFLSKIREENTLSNPAFAEAEKRGRWTGRISPVIPLVRAEKGGISLPRGYASRVLGWAKRYGIEYTFEDLRRELPMVTFESQIELRIYQEPAITAMLRGTQGVLEAPARSGKTECGLEIIARVGQPALWVTHTKDLAGQTMDRIEERLGIPGGEIGLIAGKKRRIGSRITIGMVQTLAAMGTEEFDEIAGLFGLVALDECHHVPAATFSNVIDRLPARWRYGLSVGGDSWIIVEYKGTIEHLKISELANRFNVEPNAIVATPNYKIWGYNTNVRAYEWLNLEHIHKYLNTKQTFKVKTTHGRELTITEDHSIFKVERSTKINTEVRGIKYEPKLSLAIGKELKIGDYLLLEDQAFSCTKIQETLDVTSLLDENNLYITGAWKTIIPQIINGSGAKNRGKRYEYKTGVYGPYLPLDFFKFHRNSFPLDKESRIYTEGANGHWIKALLPVTRIARLIGILIGDGAISKDQIRIFVANHQVDEMITFLESFSDLIHMKIRIIEPTRGKNSKEIILLCMPLLNLIQTIMGGRPKSYEKRIPSIVWSWPIEAIREMIDGLLVTDGSLCKATRNRNRYCYTTTSEGLANDLLHCLSHCGVIGSLYRNEPRQGGIVEGNRQIVGRHWRYDVTWSQASYNGNTSGYFGHHSIFMSNSIEGHPIKIRSIEEVSEKYVYDVSVDQSVETFIANGFLVHNTATKERADGLTDMIDRFIGPTLAKIDRSAVQASGKIMIPSLRTIHVSTVSESFVKHEERIKEWEKKCEEARLNLVKEPRPPQMNYTAILNDILCDQERNHLIVQTLIQECPGHYSLVLSEKIDHIQTLANMLYASDAGLKCAVTYGELPDRKREEILKAMKDGHLDILFAVNLAREGLDISRFDRLFLVAGCNSKAKIEQEVGRIQGVCWGKRDCMVFDFIDEVPVLAAQFWARRSVYAKLGMFGNQVRRAM